MRDSVCVYGVMFAHERGLGISCFLCAFLLEQLTVVCYQVIYRFQAAWLQGEFLDLVMPHLTMSSHFLLKEELMSVSVYVFNPV